jgi:hypothetical protein
VLKRKILICEEDLLRVKRASRVPTLKFLAVDRFSASAIVLGEIAALKHELRDHTVEVGTLIAKPVLASRELSEISCGSGDDIVVQFENDSTRRLVVDCDIKLKGDIKQHMSKHATWVDMQKQKYEDVGHGCLVV